VHFMHRPAGSRYEPVSMTPGGHLGAISPQTIDFGQFTPFSAQTPRVSHSKDTDFSFRRSLDLDSDEEAEVDGHTRMLQDPRGRLRSSFHASIRVLD
jgi:hypothetical protein